MITASPDGTAAGKRRNCDRINLMNEELDDQQKTVLRAKVSAWLAPGELDIQIDELKELLAQKTAAFEEEFKVSGGVKLSEKEILEINQWLASETGQQTLQKMAADLKDLFELMKKEKLTGHDLRHMLLSAWESVKMVHHYQWSKTWQRGAILSSLLHDWGRVLESKMRAKVDAKTLTMESAVGELKNAQRYDWPDNIHARLSFLIVETWLQIYPELPERWRQLILQAILDHPGRVGDWDNEGPLARIVQNADRLQLTGPEVMSRTMPEEVLTWGFDLKMPRGEEGKWQIPRSGKNVSINVYQRWEHFWRRVDLIDGVAEPAAQEHARTKLGRALYWMCLEWQREIIFAPEISVWQQKTISEEEYLAHEDWKSLQSKEIWEAIQVPFTPEEEEFLATQMSERDDDLWRKFMNGEGSANTWEQIKAAIKKWRELEFEERMAFRRGMVVFLLIRGQNKMARQAQWEEMKKKEMTVEEELVGELLEKYSLI